MGILAAIKAVLSALWGLASAVRSWFATKNDEDDGQDSGV